MRFMVTLAALALPVFVNAQSVDCGTASGVASAQGQVEKTMADVQADQKKREAEIKAEMDTKATAAGWSKEKQAKVMLDMLSNPKFMAFEQEKMPFSMELLNIMSSVPKGQKPDAKQTCDILKKLQDVTAKIVAVNARQYSFMAEQIRATK